MDWSQLQMHKLQIYWNQRGDEDWENSQQVVHNSESQFYELSSNDGQFYIFCYIYFIVSFNSIILNIRFYIVLFYVIFIIVLITENK